MKNVKCKSGFNFYILHLIFIVLHSVSNQFNDRYLR